MNLSKPERRAPKPRRRIARSVRVRTFSQEDLPKLKRTLWKLVSAYVKARDGNTCFTCGREGLSGHGWHAGHLFPAGSHNVIRYEPKNIHPQCFHCNINLGGNGAVYSVKFRAIYGDDEFNRLHTLSYRLKPWRAHEIVELIEAIKKGGANFECLYAEKYGL